MLRKIRNLFSRNPIPGKQTAKKSKAFALNYSKKAKKAFDSGVKKMGNEAKETKEMGKLFFRLLESKLNLEERSDPPSKQEVKEAIEQLKDVGRVTIFATAIILPGGAISLMGLEMLAAKFGVKNFTFIPSSFRKNADWHFPKGYLDDEEKEPPALEENK